MAASDRELIEHHLARYCFVVDRGTADEIAALFWDDARLDFNGIYIGHEAIRQCYADWIVEKRDRVTELRHLLYQPMIELEGDLAAVQTYADADALTRRTGRIVQLRTCYRDRLTKRDGEWRFAERHIMPMQSFSSPK